MMDLNIDNNELVEFININIIPLRDVTHKIVAYGEYLRKEFSGKNIVDIDENLRKLILGGITKSGVSENSLSKFYKEHFGVGLTDENIQRYLNSNGNSQVQKNIEISLNEEDVYMDNNKNKSMFYYMKKIDTHCSEIIAKARVKGLNIPYTSDNLDKNTYLELVENPIKVVTLLKDVYNYSLKVLPSYNEFIMFLDSITNNSADYVLEAYPKIKDSLDSFLDLMDAEINPLLKLDIDFIKFIQPINSGMLSNIIDLKYEVFSLSDFANEKSNFLFNGVEDERKKHLSNNYNSLKGMLDDNAMKILMNRTIILNVDEKGFISKYDYNFPNFSLSEFLKSILPLRFAGCISIEKYDNNAIKIINYLYGEITP